MNAKELHDWLTGPSPISEMDAEDKHTILRALSLLAAAEANDGTTPETDALPQSDDKPIKEGAMARILCRRLERERNGLAAEVGRLRSLLPDDYARADMEAREP